MIRGVNMVKLIRCLQVLLLWISMVAQVENSTVNPLSPPPANGITTYKIDFIESPKLIKMIFSISYESVRMSINEDFKNAVIEELSKLFGVSNNRISEFEITPDPRARTVLNFKLTTGGAAQVSNQVALDFFDKTTNLDLTVRDVKFTPMLQYCYWTEGECPKNDQCVSTCAQTENKTQNLYPLLVLLVIPVIIAVVLVLLWYFKYKRPSEKNRINLTELGYVENRSKLGSTMASRKGTISGLSLADNGVRNEVYTTMGKQYGFSLDKADFDDVKPEQTDDGIY